MTASKKSVEVKVYHRCQDGPVSFLPWPLFNLLCGFLQGGICERLQLLTSYLFW